MLARLQVTSAPTVEPVSVAQAADWLRCDSESDQLRVEAALAAAKAYVESITGQRFGSQTVKVWLPGFPCSSFRFPIAPISAISGINWYSTADAATAVSSGLYYFRADDQPPYLSRIVLKDGMDWPSATLRPVDGVEITVTAGHVTTPPVLKVCLLQLTAHFYSTPSPVLPVDRAQAGAVEIPHSAMALLNSFRIYAD